MPESKITDEGVEWAAKTLLKHIAKTEAAKEASQRSGVSSNPWIGALRANIASVKRLEVELYELDQDYLACDANDIATSLKELCRQMESASIGRDERSQEADKT